MGDADGVETTELKARRAFEKRRGSPFTDEEWEEAKRNLVAVFLMLGAEDAGPQTPEPTRD